MFIKQSKKRITCFLLILSFTLSFSIFAFAEAFTGAYLYSGVDPVTGYPIVEVRGVNPSGQTFSGQNVIEMNAYNNAPILTNNTFNGSTDMNLDMTNITSNGNTYQNADIYYGGLPDSYLASNNDTFSNASVSSEASDIQLNNATFNGSTTLSAQNVSLGSIPQMDSLLNLIYQYVYSWSNNVIGYDANYGGLSVNNPYNSQNITVPFVNFNGRWINYDAGTGNFVTQAVFYHSTILGWLNAYLDFICYDFIALGAFFTHRQGTFNTYTFTIDSTGETYSIVKSSSTVTFFEMVENRLDIIIKILDFWFHRFYEWYYPLDNVLPEYWRYYNTDTGQQEDISLAGLMYNISWYLGQMYVLQSGSNALDNMTDQVEAVSQTFQEAEQREQQIMDSISSGIESFNPDLSEIGAFKALGWCSNYLQLVFLRLGTYGTVILVGLLLGVCMQFIGYFRYK